MNKSVDMSVQYANEVNVNENLFKGSVKRSQDWMCECSVSISYNPDLAVVKLSF